jgi:hypothetical protein
MAYDLIAVQELVVEYADFEEVNSVARAKLFITNARRWLILCPESSSEQGSSLGMAKSTVVDLMKRAQEFVSANDTSNGSGRVRFLGAGVNFR